MVSCNEDLKKLSQQEGIRTGITRDGVGTRTGIGFAGKHLGRPVIWQPYGQEAEPLRGHDFDPLLDLRADFLR